MQFMHVADTHIDDRDPHATLEEQVRWLVAIGEDARKAGARVVLHGGDVYDRTSTPAERRAALEVFTAWSEFSSVIVVKGNHDAPADLHFLGRLRTRHPVVVCEEPGLVRLPGGVEVACLPWPRRSWLAARLGAASRMDLGQASVAALRDILSGFATGWSAGATRVLLAHAELGGASLDNGQPVAARCDVALAESDLLATGADFVALGHIHKSQTLQGRIRYPGSPRPTAFGQDDDPKGYSLVDVRRGEDPVIEHRLSSARRLITVEGEWFGQELNNTGTDIVTLNQLVPHGEPESVRGTAVRLVYEVPESDQRAAREQAERLRDRWLAEGAHAVKLDPRVTTVHRVRSEEIREARSTRERVEAYWRARDARPDRGNTILDNIDGLETAA